MSRATGSAAARPLLSAWRFVTVFGTVSLLADFVYEGARLHHRSAASLTRGDRTGRGRRCTEQLRGESVDVTEGIGMKRSNHLLHVGDLDPHAAC